MATVNHSKGRKLVRARTRPAKKPAVKVQDPIPRYTLIPEQHAQQLHELIFVLQEAKSSAFVAFAGKRIFQEDCNPELLKALQQSTLDRLSAAILFLQRLFHPDEFGPLEGMH